MSLINTSLVIESAPLPETFQGSPNDFRAELVKRFRILSPNGTNFIYIGSSEPTSNVGPWLKNGTQWWVWDDGTKRYIPLDVSASVTIPFFIGASTPASSTPPVWMLTTQNPTDQNPGGYGEPLGWYFFDGTSWVPFMQIVLSGPTASRPPAPATFQQYYDTDIQVLIWWERSAWRTISGVPGDTKFVSYETLTEALATNPGWQVFGAGNQDFRGRLVVQAAQDAGTNPVTSFPVDTNITPRGAFEFFGETGQLTLGTSGPYYPGTIALWFLVKT